MFGLGGRQVLRQCLLLETGHPAKEIQLVGRDDQPSGIAAAGATIAGWYTRARRLSIHRGPQISTTYTQLRPRLLDVQRDHSQVPVVVERQSDQVLQRFF